VFSHLKDMLVPLIAEIGEPVDDSCLRGEFSPDRQREFSLAVLSCWGMDDQAWRLDDTVHPFATAISESDIRLTARFDHDNLSGILSCLHEFGHGLYDRQVDERYARSPLREGASSAFHESQSRLWENVVGRRLSTWRFFYPRLQDAFPQRFADVRLEDFHRALNRVAPSPTRIDADEVTYPLHIVLRFELEREMLAGHVTPADLPEAFGSTSASSRRTPLTGSCRTSTGRTPTSATSPPTRSGMSSPCSFGSAQQAICPTSTRSSNVASSALCANGCASTCTGGAVRSSRRSFSSVRWAGRSMQSLTLRTCARRSRRSSRLSSVPAALR